MHGGEQIPTVIQDLADIANQMPVAAVFHRQKIAGPDIMPKAQSAGKKTQSRDCAVEAQHSLVDYCQWLCEHFFRPE